MAKPIMIQGTMSNAGKSLFAAALCRIFSQDGYRCVPFKSQNMALNSFITREGLEMGRAQVMQAEAAGVEPSVLMNPVLLKPTTDRGSQVIVNGEIYGNLSATEYFRERKRFIPDIMNAYNRLSSENDIIIIEGAGSPVELNLLKDDIVNMGMARLAESPVLLVGDIDRGGVFAQLLGTLSLFENKERDMVKGLIVNKFRGDRSLFSDGVKILEQRGGKPVVGVIPYVNIDIDDEDSLSEKIKSGCDGLIDIAVIKLPRISNFTDFDVFRQYNGVSVRYVSSPNQLGTPDMLIIPGTKSTISDIKWLRGCGLESAIKRLASEGVPVFGICGGYQMLGKSIYDPDGAECSGKTDGIGLLNISTTFQGEKTRSQTKGIIRCGDGFFSVLNGCRFTGYEIHMGISDGTVNHFLELDNGKSEGCFSGNVCGSYIHGIFDSRDVSLNLIRALFNRKGLSFDDIGIDRETYKQTQYDLWADIVRKNADIEMIYSIIEKGI